MKVKILSAIALAAVSAASLCAQNINGTWQGTLSPGPQTLRLVFKIEVGADDKLKATGYSIDQGSPPIPITTITRDGSTVKMTVAAIGGSYEGKLSSDGNTITGTFTQGGPLPLILTRATPATEWTIPEPPPPPQVMDAAAKPSFEVATIKPAKPDERFSLLVNRAGMLNTTSTSLSDLIKFAYDLHPRQISGAQGWAESEKYDVTGKPDTPGLPSVTQLKGMVQKLLAERFQLKFHYDKKELPVYAITVLKTGAKITKDDRNPNGLPGFGGGGRGGMRVNNATIAEFASILQANVLDQPVVDQTGFGKDRWDFTLRWTPDGTPPAAGDNADAPPDIFAAFEQQLGLKITSTKAPVDVLVIDHVDKPSDN